MERETISELTLYCEKLLRCEEACGLNFLKPSCGLLPARLLQLLCPLLVDQLKRTELLILSIERLVDESKGAASESLPELKAL